MMGIFKAAFFAILRQKNIPTKKDSYFGGIIEIIPIYIRVLQGVMAKPLFYCLIDAENAPFFPLHWLSERTLTHLV